MIENLNLHKSCSTLPIFSFYKIIEEYDYRYLIKGFFGETNENAELKTNKELIELFNLILKENSKQTSLDKDFKRILLEYRIFDLESKYSLSKRVLSLYRDTENIEVVFVLNDCGWKIDSTKPIGPQIDYVNRMCIGLKNKIKIEKINYANKYKKKEEAQKTKTTLNKQAIYLQSSLELGYHLDTRTCTVETWNNLKALEAEKQKYYANLKNK